jgi:hypothetical protein
MGCVRSARDALVRGVEWWREQKNKETGPQGGKEWKERLLKLTNLHYLASRYS